MVTIAPSADGTWRYRQLDDGRSGRLHPVADGWQAGPGFTDRDPAALVVRVDGDRLQWIPVKGRERHAQRVAVQERDIEWQVAGATLRGRLVLPTSPGPHPVVLHIHGSERLPAVGQWHDPYMLAAHGIAGFVYDKRGTGGSGGDFTADFSRLAEDAAAAAKQLATLPEIDRDRIGFAGFSQGGWVAPLAAEMFGAANAVLVAYGMIDSPLYEDRWQCLQAVRADGGGPRELAEVGQLVDATHQLLTSDLREGWQAFKSVVRRNRDQSWFKQLDADACIAAGFAAYPAWVVRTFAGRRLPPGIDWRHDSHALLADSSTPMLWLLASADSEAAAADTAAAVQGLAAAGKPFEVRMLDGAEHGMLMHQQGVSGPEPTGYHPEYFTSMLAFWAQRFR
jgi:dienelactone hydrolase